MDNLRCLCFLLFQSLGAWEGTSAMCCDCVVQFRVGLFVVISFSVAMIDFLGRTGCAATSPLATDALRDAKNSSEQRVDRHDHDHDHADDQLAGGAKQSSPEGCGSDGQAFVQCAAFPVFAHGRAEKSAQGSAENRR